MTGRSNPMYRIELKASVVVQREAGGDGGTNCWRQVDIGKSRLRYNG